MRRRGRGERWGGVLFLMLMLSVLHIQRAAFTWCKTWDRTQLHVR